MADDFERGWCRHCKELILLTVEGRIAPHNLHWRNQFGKESLKPLNDGTNWFGVKCIGGGAWPKSDPSPFS